VQPQRFFRYFWGIHFHLDFTFPFVCFGMSIRKKLFETDILTIFSALLFDAACFRCTVRNKSPFHERWTLSLMCQALKYSMKSKP